jgi:hypothetical protein
MLIFKETNNFTYSDKSKQIIAPLVSQTEFIPFQLYIPDKAVKLHEIYLKRDDLEINITSLITVAERYASTTGVVATWLIFLSQIGVIPYCGKFQLKVIIRWNTPGVGQEFTYYSNFFEIVTEDLNYLEIGNSVDFNDRLYNSASYVDKLYFKDFQIKHLEVRDFEDTNDNGDDSETYKYEKSQEVLEVKLWTDSFGLHFIKRLKLFNEIRLQYGKEFYNLVSLTRRLNVNFDYNTELKNYEITLQMTLNPIEMNLCLENYPNAKIDGFGDFNNDFNDDFYKYF